MPESHSPELVSWLDEEISSLLDAFDAETDAQSVSGAAANGSSQPGKSVGAIHRLRKLRSHSPWPTHHVNGFTHRLRTALRARAGTLAFWGVALAGGVVVGWVVTTLLTP